MTWQKSKILSPIIMPNKYIKLQILTAFFDSKSADLTLECWKSLKQKHFSKVEIQGIVKYDDNKFMTWGFSRLFVRVSFNFILETGEQKLIQENEEKQHHKWEIYSYSVNCVSPFVFHANKNTLYYSADVFTKNQLEMFCSFHYSPQWKIIAKFVSRRLGLAPLPPRRSKFADLREKTGSGSSGFIQQLPLACSIHPSSPSKQQPRKHHHHPPPARIQQFIYLLGFFPETPCWLHLAAKLGWNSGLIVILSRGGFAVSASGATLAHQQRSLQHKTQRTLRPRD